MSALNDRQMRLLEALPRGVITTDRVHRLNRQLGAPKRTTARHDIAALHRQKLLIQGGSADARFYLLTRKAATYRASTKEATR